MTPRGTLEVGCVHITQLMTLSYLNTIIYLALCYKPLCIPQRVSKSQKVHISSRAGF